MQLDFNVNLNDQLILSLHSQCEIAHHHIGSSNYMDVQCNYSANC